LSSSTVTWAKPAGGADPYDAARDAEGRLDYKAVVVQSNRALETAQTHDRLVNLYRLLGTANALVGKNQDAIDAFQRLLAIDPDHKLPRGTSPKITGPFREAGGFWVDRPGGLQIVPTLPKDANSDKPLAIPVKIDDAMSLTANVRMSYRQQGESEWKTAETPVGASITLNVPPTDIPTKASDYVLEIYFAAMSSNGSELRLAGEAARPLSIAIRGPGSMTTTTTTTGAIVNGQPDKPRKPLIKTWWFWAAVGGAAVVAIGLGAGLGYYYGRPDTSITDVNVSSKLPALRF